MRRRLSHYGIRPVKSEIRRATWVWADAIAHSYWHVHWPLPSEIGTQYILLLPVEMKRSCMLRLPYRAEEIVPPEVAALQANHPTGPRDGGGKNSRAASRRRQLTCTR